MTPLILLIDDAPAIHALVRGHLADDNVTIRSAYDSGTGLSLARCCAPDLVLLDVDVPLINGFEVCLRLQECPLTAATPVIFLTAASDAEQKVFAFDCGAADYITKPFHPDEFIARVRHALRDKARMDFMRSSRVNDFVNEALRPLRANRAA